MKISELKPLERNPFKSKGDEQIKKIADSISSFEKMMRIRKIVIDENNQILGGNKRFFACKRLGMKEIPDDWIDKQTDLTEDEKREFIVKDNSHWGSEWDYDLLKEWDVDLDDWGVDLPDGWEDEKTEAIEDNYEIPDEIETDIVLGDLFEIGEHRLLCGDSTDSDQVAKLMNGEKADMVFTDPPYGVSYQSNMRTKTEKFDVLENDNVFITEWINNLPLFSKGFVFVWTSWKVLKQWIEFCEQIGELSNLIIWDKGGGGIDDLKKTFSTDFEVALVYNRGAEIKGKRLGSVWSIGKDGSSTYLHPTQKPVGLPSLAIENVSIKNDIILDLFLGSGSTMVAAHQLNRKCYGMELDCKYAEVIVRRMIKLDNTLTIKRNGIDETQKWLDKLS